MRRYAAAIVLMLAAFTQAADAPPVDQTPRSEQAQAAIVKSRQAIDAANALCKDGVHKARQDETAELSVALKSAMIAGDLNEANAISGLLAKLKDADAGRAAFTDIDWHYRGGSGFVRFRPGGVAVCNSWNGKPGQWRQVDDNTIVEIEPAGVQIHITFTSDRKNSLWVYPNNDIAWAVARP